MNISRIERIKNILCKEYGDNNFLIKDNSKEHKGHSGFDGKNETHIRIEVFLKKSEKISRIDEHRKINLLLKKEFTSGLHALEIKILQTNS